MADSSIQKLRNKLSERLNWDTFTSEIGQGMETLPTPMTVLMPSTIGKFAKEFASNTQLMDKTYKKLPGSIRDAWAFIKTRYPTTWDKIDELTAQFVEGEGGHYARTTPKTGIVNITPRQPYTKDYIETMGHELGHNVVQRRWPKIYNDPEIENYYQTRSGLNELLSNRSSQQGYYIEELRNQLSKLSDVIENDPNEIIPKQFGKTARKSYDKFLELMK